MHYVIRWLDEDKPLYIHGYKDIKSPFNAYTTREITNADKYNDFDMAKKMALAFDIEDSRQHNNAAGTAIIEIDGLGEKPRVVFLVKNSVILQDHCTNIFTKDWD